MKNKLCLVLVVVAVICLAGWTTQAELQRSNPERRAWDYMEVELDTRFPTAPKLNQFGKDGWELVNVISSCPSSPDATIQCRYWAYMKRAK
jgi:hypothetical protein